MMALTEQQYDALMDDDEDDGLFMLPDESATREIYQVGNNTIPQWLMEAIAKSHVIYKNGNCLVLIKGRYIVAPLGFYVIRFDTYYSVESPRQNQ